MDKSRELPTVMIPTDHECEGIYIYRIDSCPVCGFSHIEAMFHFVKWWDTFGSEEGPAKCKPIGLINTTISEADMVGFFFEGADPIYFRHTPHGQEWDDYVKWQYELYCPEDLKQAQELFEEEVEEELEELLEEGINTDLE